MEFHHWYSDRASLLGNGRRPGSSFRPVLALQLDVDERETATVISPRLREVGVRQLLAGDPALVLDLTGLEFLDSTGLGVIVGLLKRARTLGSELHLVIARERVRAPFRVTGIDTLLPIHDDLDAALASLGGAP